MAAYYLDQELTNRKDEIDQIPFDEEVLAADEAAKVRSEALREMCTMCTMCTMCAMCAMRTNERVHREG